MTKNLMLASALAITLSSGIAISTESTSRIIPANLNSTERTELEAMMAEHIQLTLKRMKPQEGQLFPAKVSAKFNGDGMLLIELGRRFIARTDGTTIYGVEDQLHELSAVLYTVVTEVKFEGIEYLFEGRKLEFYYPELRPRTKSASSQTGSAYPPFPPYVPPPVR